MIASLDKVIPLEAILVGHPINVWKVETPKSGFRVPTHNSFAKLFVGHLYVAYLDPAIFTVGDHGSNNFSFVKAITMQNIKTKIK